MTEEMSTALPAAANAPPVAASQDAAAFRHLYAPGAAAPFAPVLEPIAAACGYRLVRLRLCGGGQARLQVMAEHAQRLEGAPTGFSHADCMRLSHALQSALDGLQEESGGEVRALGLEVSSPGLARPLTRAEDFMLYRGQRLRLRLAVKSHGRRVHEGALLGLAEGQIVLGMDKSLDAGLDETRLHVAPALIAAAELVPDEDALRQDLRAARSQVKRKGKHHGHRH